LFCISFVVVVVVIIVVVVPSFVALLNCLYLNPRALLFVCSPTHPTGTEAGGERAAVWC